MKQRFSLYSVVLLIIVGIIGTALPVAANPTPDEAAFERVWTRTDGATARGETQRPWYWGPEPLATFDEDYIEGVNGVRRVQYYDKGRMEISNPHDDPQSAWYVSSGMLPIEMISGRVRLGDVRLQRRARAAIPIAGDPDPISNPDAPTYADFFSVTTVFLDSRLQPISASPIGPQVGDNPAPPRFGDLVAEGLDADGNIIRRPELAAAHAGTRLVSYDGTLSHNIPQVFWDFLQQIEQVAVNGENRADMPIDWLYLVGHPASEPYWITTNVDNQPTDLLVQVYERRVLTYNPANPLGWQVEMGNVGQHYLTWRYELTAPPPPPSFDRPPNVSATATPEQAPAGTDFTLVLFGFTPGEEISLWVTLPDQSVVPAPELGIATATGEASLFGRTPITLFTRRSDPIGVWAVTGQGNRSGHIAIAYVAVLPNE